MGRKKKQHCARLANLSKRRSSGISSESRGSNNSHDETAVVNSSESRGNNSHDETVDFRGNGNSSTRRRSNNPPHNDVHDETVDSRGNGNSTSQRSNNRLQLLFTADTSKGQQPKNMESFFRNGKGDVALAKLHGEFAKGCF